MKVIVAHKQYFWDVDNTLIIWEKGAKWHAHVAHIQLMEQFKYQGHANIVWSAGGALWAEKAVEMLGITHLVDIIINKPDGYCDDKKVTEFMPDTMHFYLKE